MDFNMRKYLVKFLNYNKEVKKFFVYAYDWNQANTIATLQLQNYRRQRNSPVTEMWMDNIGQLAIKNW